MMRSISNELSRCARHLAARDGRPETSYGEDTLFQYLATDRLDITVNQETGTLVIQDALTTDTIMVEAGNGALAETSPDDVLEDVLDYLRRRMILDELAGL